MCVWAITRVHASLAVGVIEEEQKTNDPGAGALQKHTHGWTRDKLICRGRKVGCKQLTKASPIRLPLTCSHAHSLEIHTHAHTHKHNRSTHLPPQWLWQPPHLFCTCKWCCVGGCLWSHSGSSCSLRTPAPQRSFCLWTGPLLLNQTHWC